jgi:hypothetical protein
VGKLISYPEQRALEDAAYAHGLVPTRIFTVLLPTWRVEIRATVTDAEDYAVIDQYVERSIAEGGLDTAPDLARFLALDQVIVDRALRFLIAIEHVHVTNGRFALTQLGVQSVRDQKSYRLTRHDRRKLYFDAFGSRPLTRPYYDSRVVTFIQRHEASTALDAVGGRGFMLANTPAFRREVLTELAHATERDAFNLPERIDDPQSVAEEYVYLPLYLVRAARTQQPPRYLAYSQISDESDPYLTSICENTEEIISACEHDSTPNESGEQNRITEWLARRNLGRNRPSRTAESTWRVTLPAAAFGRDGALSLSQLGSYIVLGNFFFHAWCADEPARQHALVERVNAYLGARSNIVESALTKRVEQMSRQLELGTVDLSTLRRWAAEAGRSQLASQLAPFD